MSLKTRGSTLIELVIAVVLLGLLGVTVGRLLIAQVRVAGSLFSREVAQRTLDEAGGWLSTELSEIGRDSSSTDLRRLGADSLSYRGYRASGLACQVSPSEVRIDRSHQSLWRLPQPGRDSVAVFLSGGWRAAPLHGVATALCGATPALSLSTELDTGLVASAHGMVPVRTFESMQVRLYRSQGEWWLGGRSESTGEAIQPVTGPLESGGLQFRYHDSAGAAALAPQSVRRLRILLSPTTRRDSTWVLVYPRNFE
jgi:hypothetical protein